MRLRFAATFLAVAARRRWLVAAASGAAMIGIYRNGMEITRAARAADQALRRQLRAGRLRGRRCGSRSARRTDACSYRTPVLGRDLEIAATERLLSGTPKALQRKAYLALELRAGAGAKYQLLAFPLQRKVQLVKVTAEGHRIPGDRTRTSKTVMGVNKANALRLRALNIAGPKRARPSSPPTSAATLVTEATDEAAGDLTGARLGRRGRRHQERQRRHRQRRRRRRPRPGRLRRVRKCLAGLGADRLLAAAWLVARLGVRCGVLRTRRGRGGKAISSCTTAETRRA